jgi:hypothetical protein
MEIWFLEKMNKIEKPLTDKEKEEKTQITQRVEL